MSPLHGLSDQYLETVRGEHTAVCKIEVNDPRSGDTQDITGLFTSDAGNNLITVDEANKIRRTGQLVPQGDPELVPDDASDLLHPASGNEIRPYRGVQYADGTTEFAPLGVFRISKPVFDDDGAVITATLSLNDRSSVISRIDWQAPYVVPAGNNMGLVLIEAIASRLPPGMTLDYSGIDLSIDFSYPTFTWGTDPSQSGDPMQDFITFAGEGGAELFFDPIGNPILREIINPLTSTVVDTVSFVSGPTSVFHRAAKTLDETTAFNGVRLTCNGVGVTQPFVVSVWDTDPTSASYVNGPWGQVPLKITTTAIPSGVDDYPTASGKALKYAYGQLQLVLTSFNDATLNCIPNGALREGDCVAIQQDRIKLSGGFVISNFTMPLDVESDMPIGFRPRVGV